MFSSSVFGDLKAAFLEVWRKRSKSTSSLKKFEKLLFVLYFYSNKFFKKLIPCEKGFWKQLTVNSRKFPEILCFFETFYSIYHQYFEIDVCLFFPEFFFIHFKEMMKTTNLLCLWHKVGLFLFLFFLLFS